MFDTLKLRIYQGKQYIKDIKNAPMRNQFRGYPLINSSDCNVDDLKSICPADAISDSPLSIDIGKCTFCGECSRRFPDVVKFSNYYKTASTKREHLIITENLQPEEYKKYSIEVNAKIKRVFHNSLKLRQVSAGGCNGCEMELNACSNVNFDMGRFGIDFVASPRHADGIVITGPITENMAYALEDCYKSVPEPKIVILCGACAVSGGVFYNSDTLNREFLEKYPVDLYIPGCPVHPLTFINAILDFIGE